MATIFISPHKKLVYIFAVLTLAVLIITLTGLVQQLYQATIFIYSKRNNIELNFSETFEAQILQETTEAEETFAPKTIVTMEDFASGEVIITNNSAQNQTLVANTRLLSPENLLFRLTNKVVIPANQKIKTKVRADKTGQEYEIGPTKFTIPGLSPILQTKIYAESKEPMIGGFKKTGIITQKDIDNATNNLKEKLQKDAIANLEKKINNPNLKIALRSEIVKLDSNAKVNDEKENFTIKMTLKTTAALITEEELMNKTNEKLVGQIPNGQKLASIDQSTFAYRLKSYDLENQKATLEMYIAGQTMLNENNELLSKKYFIGRTKDEIKQYLSNIEDIERVKVQFSPFFISKSPPIEKRINIKIL